MLKTVLCDLLSIEYPILQGGMAWVATAELAAAVSEAGGLGIIAAGNFPPDRVRSEIRKLRSLTSRPFGVNIGLFSPHVDSLIELVVAERVPVITTGAGNPGKYLPILKKAGIKVIPVVASVALAKRLERAGVDAVIAEGMESGGHIGEITTMVLVPQIVDAVKIPVIAAGGIADGRGLVAALALGAVGVQIGTRFICASECTAHPNYKNAIVSAGDRDTTVTGYPGHYVRVLKNKLTRRYEELVRQGASVEELSQLGVNRLRAAVVDGDVVEGSVMAGQSSALVKKIEPAAEIIRSIVEEAERVLRKLGEMVS
ncbi:MAG: enoyl-[acyl-carrier-protein] reductase FabK, partial [Thermacetogeniaceae bacterium]